MQSPSRVLLSVDLRSSIPAWLLPVAVVIASGVTAEGGDETNYFRAQMGIYDAAENRVPETFEDSAAQAWSVPIGSGISTPCVVGDQIVLTTFDDERQELATVALSLRDGQQLWRQVCPAKTIEAYHPTGSPASSTPASDGERLFVFFGSYGLLCYDLDGQLLWEHRLGPFQDEFGASSSPVIAGDLVLLNEDHDIGSYLLAIDRRTGKEVWKVSRADFTRSYSTPVIWEHDGEQELVVAGALKLIGYDLATGEVRWWVDGLSRIVDSTPVVADGQLYLATWTPGGDQESRISMPEFAEALKLYDTNNDKLVQKTELSEGPVLQRFFRMDLDQDEALSQPEWDKHRDVFDRAQNVAMAVAPGGRGDITHTHVKWTYRRGLPTVPSPLVYRGSMYMVKDSGIITVLDARTGELQYQGRAAGRGNYYASPVAINGTVCFVSERGVLTMLNAGSKWNLAGSHDFEQRILATPVVADGRLLVRTDDALHCFWVKAR